MMIEQYMIDVVWCGDVDPEAMCVMYVYVSV